MINSSFAEDIFVEFKQRVIAGNIDVQSNDLGPILSIGDRIVAAQEITQNQGNYVVKLLEKYKNVSAAAGVDYRDKLVTLLWKRPFRVLDLSKKIYVERSESGKIEICLKFPYQLKKEFDEEINPAKTSAAYGSWDAENKVRRLNFSEVNLIALHDFVTKRSFEIDESFLEVLAEVEEIWQNSDEYSPFAIYQDNQIHLVNSSEETDAYFQQHRTGKKLDDALLAKSMGYPVRGLPNMSKYNITASPENSFWLKENKSFFNMYHEISGKVCVILDRTSNMLEWLQRFVADADGSGVSRDDIRVCFRRNKTEDKGLNDWVKLAGVGGKVDSGRIFIFENKPAKWLFKDFKDVKIIVTNSLYPATNNLTKDLFSSFPCVIYLGDIKATNARGQKIVEL